MSSLDSIIPDGSLALRASFVALGFVVAGLFVAGVYWSAVRAGVARPRARRGALVAGAAAALWMVATLGAAAAGALHFSPPPTMFVVFALTFAIAMSVAFSPLGTRLALEIPAAALVGVQAFRVVVELVLHRAYVEGLMPVQMSYEGRNFDIVTGVTAIGVALWLARGHSSPRVLFAWNTLGVALLVNILAVATLSAPTPFRRFMNEPANVWVTRAPWVWLPAVLVLAAVLGHVLIYRRIWLQRRQVAMVHADSVA